MQLEIITPEAQVFAGKADAVQLPGLDGLFQILKGHAPIIAALGQGVIKIDLPTAFVATEKTNSNIEVDAKDAKVIRININGGVIEKNVEKIVILAE